MTLVRWTQNWKDWRKPTGRQWRTVRNITGQLCLIGSSPVIPYFLPWIGGRRTGIAVPWYGRLPFLSTSRHSGYQAWGKTLLPIQATSLRVMSLHSRRFSPMTMSIWTLPVIWRILSRRTRFRNTSHESIHAIRIFSVRLRLTPRAWFPKRGISVPWWKW